MNNEELVKSLRTEINTYLKNTVADLQQEIAQMQERVGAEIERHRNEVQRFFEDLLAKGASTGVDEEFTRLVAEHLQIAYEDGSKEARDAAEAMTANAPQPEPQKQAADYTAMRNALNDISAQTSQAEILKALVNHSSHFAPRGAFFIVKSEHLVGWRTFGSEMANDVDAVREIVLSLDSNTLLGASVKQNATQHNSSDQQTEDLKLLEKLNFGEPKEMVAVPLVVRGRGVAVLYADSGENGATIDVEALESLVRVASLTVELLAAGKPSTTGVATAPSAQTTKKGRQPKNQSVNTNGSVSTPEVSSQLSESLQSKSVEIAPETSVETAFSSTGANEYEVSTEQLSSRDEATAKLFEQDLASTTEAQPQNGNGSNGSFSTSDWAFSDSSAQAPKPVENSFDSFSAPAATTTASRTETGFSFETAVPASTNFSALSGVETQPAEMPSAAATQTSARSRSSERNLELPIDVPEDERRMHNDARRFARLLVSEIKLYNEQKVREGRQIGDLYTRLRETVDRSREMYNKRVSAPVATKFDYFHYELVSTLAEGEETKLGKDYPGAAV